MVLVSWCVLAQMLSTACAFTLGLRGDVVVGSICSSARKAPALEAWSQACCSVIVGAVERGRRVLCKREMLVSMANEGRHCERTRQMCSIATGLQVRVIASTGLNALEATNVAGWELCAGNGIGVLCLHGVLSRFC